METPPKTFDSSRLWQAVVLRLPVVAVAILGLAGWFLLSNVFYGGKTYLFPGPDAVVLAGISNFGMVAAAAWVTFIEALAGFLAAIVLGISAAALMTQSMLFQRSLYPYAMLLQAVPVITVAPIIVLWFGYSLLSIILISMVLSLFPIMNSAVSGLRSTSRNLVELFAMHKASRLTVFCRLRLPAALPSILAGLRTSAGLSVIGAIVGEFVVGSASGKPGLGVQIIFAQGRLNTPLLFAEVFAASLLGFIFFQAVDWLGLVLLKHWHESAEGH